MEAVNDKDKSPRFAWLDRHARKMNNYHQAEIPFEPQRRNLHGYPLKSIFIYT